MHIADAVKAYVCEYRNDMTSYYDYQSYPNNLLITFLEIFTLRVCRALGISTRLSPMPGMVLINCAVNTLACVLVYMTAKLYVDEKYALCGYIAAVLLFGISPWTVIYYSDALCLAVPLACFYMQSPCPAGRSARQIRRVHRAGLCIVLHKAAVPYSAHRHILLRAYTNAQSAAIRRAGAGRSAGGADLRRNTGVDRRRAAQHRLSSTRSANMVRLTF